MMCGYFDSMDTLWRAAVQASKIVPLTCYDPKAQHTTGCNHRPQQVQKRFKKNISDLCNFDEHLHHLGTKSIQVALHSRIHVFTAFSSLHSSNHEPNLPKHILLTCSLKAIYRSITFRSIHSEYLSKQGLCSNIV